MRPLLKYTIVAAVSFSLLATVMNSDAHVSSHRGLIGGNDSPVSPDSTLPYSYPDQTGLDPLYYPDNGRKLKLESPSNIKTDVKYEPNANPDSSTYEVTQKIGNRLDYRPPTYLTPQEYEYYEMKKSMHDYWKQREHAESETQGHGNKNLIPPIKINSEKFDRIFGGGTIDIRPQGSAELIFGINVNKTNNPALPERQRRISTFDFDEKIQLNVIGKIGEKLKLTTNYNTESTFEWENQMKLEYTGFEDEIIKKIEAGNVTFGLNTSLITGSQTLFGIKTQLQFGRLTVTSIASQERGKKSEINVTGGAQVSTFEVTADNYEANKHFFLSQYFYNSYDNALANFPVINSGVNITRIEVWVTNRTGAVDNTRNIVAQADLGEDSLETVGTGFINVNPAEPKVPHNALNDLYAQDTSTYGLLRDINTPLASTFAPLINGYGYQQAVNYERVGNARKLATTEYTLNTRLGYISLNQALNYDEVLAVAYQYTINGQTFQVGEFSNNGISGQDAIIVKLLKSTNNVPIVSDNTLGRQKYKIWNLMMKNVYSVGAYQVNPANFQLNIWYNNPSTGTDIPFIPEGTINGKPLLQVMSLDKLNQQQQTSPDGQFDFIDGVTINSSNGRVIFPEVHPFGDHLQQALQDNVLYLKYGYPQIYDSTKTVAQTTFASKNRYKLKGSYQSASNSDISLNAVNIPAGSVVVTAGGAPLTENQDYTVDYTLGRVKIINESILNSGVPIKISLESNSLFNIQSKTLWGTHFDYRINKQFNIGATVMNLTERPVTQKTNVGEEPMSNTIFGTDINYSTDAPFLTRMVDHIPFIDTKAPSSITTQGEFAYLHPGHNKAIGKNGNSYIDDFEGTQSAIDIRSPQGWSLASVPQGQSSRFPEASQDSVESGMNRARLAWYVIDPLFLRDNGNGLTPGYMLSNRALMSDNRTREVLETEVFPNKQAPNGQPQNISMLDLAYYPGERGPYNYDVAPISGVTSGLDVNGNLNNPATRWGGIMRRVETNDFEAANIEYIQFWMMDPYNEDNPPATANTTGELVFDLGNISEDVLKDSRNSFENGLPSDGSATGTDNTAWGRVPVLQSIVNAFDNDAEKRKNQDVGLDGLGDNDERTYFASYLNHIAALYGTGSGAYLQANKDPSGDNYHYYRGTDYDAAANSILERYKKFNGLEGNSLTQGQTNADGYNENYSTQATTLPNQEDINRDNTLSENESYYEYRVKLTPNEINTSNVGSNYITDYFTTTKQTLDGRTRPITWYQFKIPVKSYTAKIGNIENFNSIRFIRMYFKGVDKPVVCRFARLEFVRSDWRKYDYSLLSPGEYISNNQSNTEFDLAAVNIEENGSKIPVNYVLPPGIDREQNVQSATIVRLNEQALSMKVCDLEDGDSRAAYKTIANLDVRSYKKIRMFIHAENRAGSTSTLNNGDLTAFIRMGSDQTDNYYEYSIPLVVTPAGTYSANDDADRLKVWPEDNNLELEFELLQYVKQQRNIAEANGTASLTQEFTMEDPNHHGRFVTVKGNPNLSMLKVFMLGVRNPKKNSGTANDDGQSKCAEIWFNELRLTDFDESGGWAATARVNAKLADFATVNLSGNMMTPGFGSIENKVSERSRENQKNYDISTQVELGKFFGDKSGIRLPMFYGFGETFITPQYNPLDPDILLKPVLNNENLSKDARDSIRSATVDYTRRKSINFTNVHKERAKGKKKSYFWDIENFTVSYAYTELYHHNVNVEYSILKNYRGGLTYSYSPQIKPIKPFEKAAWAKSKWLTLLREMSVTPAPTMFGFTTDLNRQYGETKNRNITGFTDVFTPTFFNKTFIWTRSYDLRWDLTKNLKMDFSADNLGNVLEPAGKIDTKSEKDSVWTNIKSFGTTTSYHHTTNVTYNVPLNKIPVFDWITPTVRYSSGFSWQKGLMPPNDTLGNTIGNNSKWDYTVQLNMTTAYNHSKYLKRINSKKPGEKPPAPKLPKLDPKKPMTHADSLLVQHIKDSLDKANNQYIIVEYLARLMMSLRTVSATYSVNSTLGLPGYLPHTQILGFDKNFDGPGAGFLFGQQDNFGKDNESYPEYAIKHDWITHTQGLYTPYTQGTSKNLTIRATLEPFPDVRIELTANRTSSLNNSEFIHWNPTSQSFDSLSHTQNGSFSMSIISWHSAFVKDNKTDHSSKTFTQFLNNRAVISKRLGEKNPYSSGQTATGFADGYGSVQQDVIIPAFVAAYTGKKAENTSLGLFPAIPLPNWHITYDGLTKYAPVKKHFKTIAINHTYRSTYSLSGFQTNLDYEDLDHDGFPDNVRNVSGDFQSKYQIGTVTISEQFAPFASVDLVWNNSLSTKVEYKKDRTMSLSLANTQLTEISGRELVVGAGYRVPKLPLKFMKKIMRGKIPTSDLNIRADISYRNNQTVIRKSVEDINVLTAGQNIFSIKTSVDYQLTQQLQIRFFCDRIMTNPLISSAFKTANTNAGLSLRFMLQ